MVRAETLHVIVLLALVGGLAASTFAYVESVDPQFRTVCSVSPFFSCGKIDTSNHTTTFGVQDYSIGIAGYLLMLGIDLPLFRSWRAPWLRALTVVSGLGVVFSGYLAYVELVLIQGLCPVCLSAYLANGIAFAALLGLLWKGRRGAEEAGAERAPEHGAPAETAAPTR